MQKLTNIAVSSYLNFD